MVGFNNIIVFNNNGKIIDYQKSYNKEYAKILNIFLPLNFNNKKNYHIELSMAIDNTYPREIIKIDGVKSEEDLNKYTFNLSELYRNYYVAQKKKPGLSRIRLYTDNGRVKFESESFRI